MLALVGAKNVGILFLQTHCTWMIQLEVSVLSEQIDLAVTNLQFPCRSTVTWCWCNIKIFFIF